MEFWEALIILKEIKKQRQIFACLGEKRIKIWNFWENLKISIPKSQWKGDFFTHFLSYLTGLLSFHTRLQPCKIWGVEGLLWAWGGYFRVLGGGVGGADMGNGERDMREFTKLDEKFLDRKSVIYCVVEGHPATQSSAQIENIVE